MTATFCLLQGELARCGPHRIKRSGGRVVRVVPETGTLVKAKQPLIEVEPL